MQNIKALLGFSRAPVAVFVVAHAGLAAVLALNSLPSANTIIIGIIACLTGSAALIGYNDILDIKIDTERLKFSQNSDNNFDIGSTFIHHPIAKGILSLKAGIIWVVFMSSISTAMTYLIQPLIAPILLLVAIFVTFYSWLGKRTSLGKTIAVACAVVIGAIAGWLAVEPKLENFNLFLTFVLLTFFWEIGGRNIPNDFGDLEEDKKLGLKTIPVIYGPKVASFVSVICLSITFIIGIMLTLMVDTSLVISIMIMLSGVYLLLIPSINLVNKAEPSLATKLFNKACLYPVALLILLILDIYVVKP